MLNSKKLKESRQNLWRTEAGIQQVKQGNEMWNSLRQWKNKSIEIGKQIENFKNLAISETWNKDGS